MLNVKQGDIKYQFWVVGMTRPGIEPRSLGPRANTLFIRLMQFYFKHVSLLYVHILNVKTVLFQLIQFSIISQFKI